MIGMRERHNLNSGFRFYEQPERDCLEDGREFPKAPSNMVGTQRNIVGYCGTDWNYVIEEESVPIEWHLPE